MNNNKEKQESIGALWEKTGKGSGKKFYTGNITVDGKKREIVVFLRDKNPDKPKSPSAVIFPRLEQINQETSHTDDSHTSVDDNDNIPL